MNDPADDVLDAQLDRQLRAAFAPPPADALTQRVHAAIAPRARAPRRWPWLAGVATAAAAVVLALLLARPARGPEGHDGAQLGAMFAAAYEHAVANVGRGAACCDPHSDFGAACAQRFAVRLEVGGGLEVQGCYCGLPTGGCVALLARADRGLVGVFALPRAQDPRPRLPHGSPLHLSRRELGDVVLYCVCREPSPQTLASFALAP
jgi:hypothetical protein